MKLVVSILQSESVESEIVNVILITGQSNAVGYAPTTDLDPSDLDPFPNVKIWNDDPLVREWEVLSVDNNQIDPQTQGTRHGIEIALARKYYDNFTEPLYISKFGWGGTNIRSHMSYGSDQNVWVYPDFWDGNVIPSINALLAQGKRPRVWVYWHQGESDSESYYETAFGLWQTQTRDLLKNQNIPFFLTEIITNPLMNDVFDTIVANPSSNAQKIAAEDLTDIGDATHFDTAAFETIVDRLLIKLVATPPIELTETLDLTGTLP